MTNSPRSQAGDSGQLTENRQSCPPASRTPVCVPGKWAGNLRYPGVAYESVEFDTKSQGGKVMDDVVLSSEQEVAAVRIEEGLKAGATVGLKNNSRLLASKSDGEFLGKSEHQIRDGRARPRCANSGLCTKANATPGTAFGKATRPPDRLPTLGIHTPARSLQHCPEAKSLASTPTPVYPYSRKRPLAVI